MNLRDVAATVFVIVVLVAEEESDLGPFVVAVSLAEKSRGNGREGSSSTTSPFPITTSTAGSNLNGGGGGMQALWPYNSYKPSSWDKYYVNEFSDSEFHILSPEPSSSVSSGVAAGVTIAIFFMVFLFTFGCRIYSQYVDRTQEELAAQRRPAQFLSENMAADLWICGIPREPPPPYEVAIQMPTHCPPPPAIV